MADNIIITGIDETRGLYDEYVMECQSAGITPMSYDAWYDDLWNWNSAEMRRNPRCLLKRRRRWKPIWPTGTG